MAIEPFEISKDYFNHGVVLPDGELTEQDELILQKYCIGKDLAVEVGCFKGRSAAIMSLFANNVISIDYFPAGTINYSYDMAVNNLKPFRNVKVIHNMSWEEGKNFKPNSIDVFYQDAGHSVNDVVMDYEAFYHAIKKDGIVIFHDYKYMDGKFDDKDVQGGVKKLLEKNILKQVEISGWCFVGRKI